eukprot:1150154-Pelagomonas_calceolata.AAC.1
MYTHTNTHIDARRQQPRAPCPTSWPPGHSPSTYSSSSSSSRHARAVPLAPRLCINPAAHQAMSSNAKTVRMLAPVLCVCSSTPGLG